MWWRVSGKSVDEFVCGLLSNVPAQVLHAGRYAYHPWAVAPSAERAPINQHTPEALSTMDVHYTVRDFIRYEC